MRDNTSWIIGRIVRDFESWVDDGEYNGRIRKHLDGMIQARWDLDKAAAEQERPGSSQDIRRPSQAGLCVSISKAGPAVPG